MAFHPSGEWLAVAGNPFGLIALGEEPHWRDLYVAGKESAAEVREIMLRGLGQTDVDAIMKGMRAAMEVMIEQKRREVERAGQSAETKEIVERERARLEKQFEEESWFLRLKQDPNAQPPRKANQAVTATGFSRNGEWLWCGTDVGFRIYRWSEVPRTAGSDLLEPALGPARPFDGHVHAIAEEVDASAIVFSVLSGLLLRLELSTGETRELVQVPGHVAIFGLTMSADGKTLGLTTQATQVTGRNARKWTWQVWDYSLLRGQE